MVSLNQPPEDKGPFTQTLENIAQLMAMLEDSELFLIIIPERIWNAQLSCYQMTGRLDLPFRGMADDNPLRMLQMLELLDFARKTLMAALAPEVRNAESNENQSDDSASGADQPNTGA